MRYSTALLSSVFGILLIAGSPLLSKAQLAEPAATCTLSDITYAVELGYGQSMQSGTYMPANVTGSKGGSILGAGFAEYQVSKSVALGVRLSVGSQHMNSTQTITDTAVLQSPAHQSDTISPLSSEMIRNFTFTLVGITPYVSFTSGAAFLRVGPTISAVQGSHYVVSRHLAPSQQIRFANGTSDEVVLDKEVSNVRSLLFSALVGAGFDIPIGRFTISPMVNYDLPLSTLSTTPGADWRMSTLYGSIALKFGL